MTPTNPRALKSFWVVYREGLRFRAYRWAITDWGEHRVGMDSAVAVELADVRAQIKAWFRELGAFAQAIPRWRSDADNIVETWACDVPPDLIARGAR